MRLPVATVLMGSILVFTAGCGGSSDPKVTMVDLDKVLEVFEATLKEKPRDPPKQDPKVQANAGNDVRPVADNAKQTAEFLSRFAANLNKAKLIEEPLGVYMERNGQIVGFVDKDKNNQKLGTDEKEMFRLQIDTQHKPPRVIASQTVEGQSYHRDRPYEYRPRFGGLFMGYMLGSMMSRQSNFYNGRPPRISQPMSPRGYYSSARSSAVSRARTRMGGSRGGARGGGSRGFRGGK